MSIDRYSNMKRTRAISPISPSVTGTITGEVIDTAGFRSNTFFIEAGLQTTNNITVTPVVLSGTVTATLTSVADDDLLGTEAAANLDGDDGSNNQSKIGYTGTNRYIRLDLIVLNAASGVYSAVCVQGAAVKAPVA